MTTTRTRTRCAVLAGLVVLSGSWVLGLSAEIQKKLTDAEFSKLAISARTVQDHQKLATHYLAHAAEHEADAKLHEQLATQYSKTRPFDDTLWDRARDASHYAQHSREAAEALRDLAAIHKALAEGARGT